MLARVETTPVPMLRIGVLTSHDSDGWNDFLHHLEESDCGFDVTLFPIAFSTSTTQDFWDEQPTLPIGDDLMELLADVREATREDVPLPAGYSRSRWERILDRREDILIRTYPHLRDARTAELSDLEELDTPGLRERIDRPRRSPVRDLRDPGRRL